MRRAERRLARPLRSSRAEACVGRKSEAIACASAARLRRALFEPSVDQLVFATAVRLIVPRDDVPDVLDSPSDCCYFVRIRATVCRVCSFIRRRVVLRVGQCVCVCVFPRARTRSRTGMLPF